MWLPESEFRRKHASWHRSEAARAMKKRLYQRQNGLCARCKKPLHRGVLNLTDYGTMKSGAVQDHEANLLHWRCHRKGTYSWEKLRADRSFDRDMAWIEWTCRLVWRLVTFPFRRTGQPRPRGGSRL